MNTIVVFCSGRMRHLWTVFFAALVSFINPALAFAAIDNTAQVTATPPAGADVTDSASESVTVETPNASFLIVKSIPSISTNNGSDSAFPDGGDIVTVQYAVQNNGNVTIDASTLSITDNDPTFNGVAATNSIGAVAFSGTGDTNGDSEINPGETWIYQASYTLAQVDVDNAVQGTPNVSSVLDTASADDLNGTGATFDTGNSTQTATGTISQNAVVALTKVATRDGTTPDDGSGTPYAPGEDIIYRLSVSNNGNVTLSSLTVAETAFTGTGGSPAVVCPVTGDGTIGSLAPGATVVCTATYTVVEGDL